MGIGPPDYAAGIVNLCKLHRLPVPVREHPFERWSFDAAWPELKLAVEVQGGAHVRGRHHRPKGYEGDCRKLNAAQLTGWLVLWIVPEWIESGEAAELIAQGLISRGFVRA